MYKNIHNLLIRTPKREDAKKILEYLKIIGGETDNLSFGKEGHPNTIEEEEIFLSSINEKNNRIMLIGIIDEDIVTIGSLMGSKFKRLRHSVEFGISVKKAYWNKGIATQIIHELINKAKTYKYIKQITLHVLVDNTSAIHLYKKIGFLEKGVFPNHMHINNEYKDSLFMVLKL
jgi:RimJ/RimL family protein N-acetyltransferase